MNEELESHIRNFPTDFDGTSVAHQLREAGVSVRLYAEVRDALWVPLWTARKKVSDREGDIRNILAAIYDTVGSEFFREFC